MRLEGRSNGRLTIEEREKNPLFLLVVSLKVDDPARLSHLDADISPSYAIGFRLVAGFHGGEDASPMIAGRVWPEGDVVEIPRQPSLSDTGGKTILKLIQERGIVGVSATL